MANAHIENPLALDPYGPVTPTPERSDSKADPLALDPYSPIVGRPRADRDGGAPEGERTR